MAPLGVAGLRVVVQATVRAAPCGTGLAEIVEERRETNCERVVQVGGRLHDRERVLVNGEPVVAALLVEAERGLELRQQLDEDAGVPCNAKRLGRLAAEEQFRQLAEPVGCEAAADALARDEADGRCFLAHLTERGVVGLEAELRDEPQRPHEAQRVPAKLVGDTVRSTPRSRSVRPSSGSTISPLDSRRAIALTVKSRLRMSSSTDSDASATISKSCLPGPVLTSLRGGANSIPAGTSRRIVLSRGCRRTPTSRPATTRSSTRPC